MKQTHRPPRSIYPAQNRHMRRRTRVLAGLVAVLCFGGLLARLFTLQILDPSGYANRAAAQQLRDTTLPAARGEIYSADGVTLAASKTCWTIRASPRELADELVQPAAKALSEILNIDYDATLQKLSKRTSNDCLLRRRVDADLADAVRAWCTQNNAQGIQILQDTKRVYPQGNFMGCLLGFTDVDNQGLWGLELQYDAQLTGRNGTILTAKNAWGYDMPTHYSTLQDAVPGNDITLTIRADIQHYLESALSAAVAEHHVAARAVGIVMEPISPSGTSSNRPPATNRQTSSTGSATANSSVAITLAAHQVRCSASPMEWKNSQPNKNNTNMVNSTVLPPFYHTHRQAFCLLIEYNERKMRILADK